MARSSWWVAALLLAGCRVPADVNVVDDDAVAVAPEASAPVLEDRPASIEAPPPPAAEAGTALADTDQACIANNPNPPGSSAGVMVTGDVLEACARAGYSGERCNPDAWISARAAHCIALRHGLSPEAQVSVNVQSGGDGQPRFEIVGEVDEQGEHQRRRAEYRYQVDANTGDVRAESTSISAAFHFTSASSDAP